MNTLIYFDAFHYLPMYAGEGGHAFIAEGILAFATTFVIFGIMRWFGDEPGDDGKHSAERADDYYRAGRREQELEEQLDRIRSLLHRTTSLTATMSVERVLDTALDLGATAVADSENGGHQLVSILFLFSEISDRLEISSARGLTHADLRVECAGSVGVLERALTTCEIQMITEPANDPELLKISALHPCHSLVCLPLSVGLEVYGLLVFAHPQADFFTRERLDLLDVVAQQAMVALQNAQLFRDLAQEKERMMEIQEEARHKLARDLHDGPTQSVGAIAMRVNFARRLMERDTKAAAEELYKIEELSRRTSKEIRQMLFTLRPLIIESDGLVAGLQDLADKTRDTHGQNVIVEADQEAVEGMEVGKQGVAFFIVEEAVNNARKHAQADHIWVRLKRNGDLMFLEIEDDGVGFDVQEVEQDYQKRGSLGMINLQERAELISGILKVDSAPGRGTRIGVAIPLSIEAAEKLHRPGFNS